MLNYQFYVKRPGKIDGKQRSTGDEFPFDPANETHRVLFEQGVIDVRKVEPPKQQTKQRKRSKK